MKRGGGWQRSCPTWQEPLSALLLCPLCHPGTTELPSRFLSPTPSQCRQEAWAIQIVLEKPRPPGCVGWWGVPQEEGRKVGAGWQKGDHAPVHCKCKCWIFLLLWCYMFILGNTKTLPITRRTIQGLHEYFWRYVYWWQYCWLWRWHNDNGRYKHMTFF